MWDPPRPGLEPVSPALAGRFSTTAPPRKPPSNILLNESCVFVDDLVCFLLYLCCSFLLEFSTSSFLSMETLYIKGVIFLILAKLFSLLVNWFSLQIVHYFGISEGEKDNAVSERRNIRSWGKSDGILICFQCFKAPEWEEVHCMCLRAKGL